MMIFVVTDLQVGAAIDLRDAVLDGLGAELGGLAGRQDHTGVGHCQTEDGDDFFEGVVIHKVLGVDVQAGSVLDARERDGVRSHVEACFQVVGVTDHGQHLETPVVEAEEDAETVVVDTGLLGAVHGGEAPLVVALDGVGGVVPAVCLGMVSLLENLVSAYASFFYDAETFHIQRGGVDVHAADGAVAFVHRVG